MALPTTITSGRLGSEHRSDHVALHTRFNQASDVKGHGALGDGVTLDTAAFHLARDEAGVGGTVIVPPGIYPLDSVLLNVAKQTWRLQDGAVLKVKNSSATGTVLDIQAEHVSVLGGEFDGNRANNVGAGYFGSSTITVRGSYATVRDVFVHDSPGYGIKGVPSAPGTALNDVTIENSTFINTNNCGAYFDFNVPTTSSNGSRIVGCWFDNSAVAIGDVLGCGFAFHGNTVTVANQPRGCVISNCYVKGRTDSTVVTGGIGMSLCNTGQVVGCYVEGTYLAYTFPTSLGLSISGCTAYGPTNYGFEFVGAGTISGCTVDGNGVSETGIIVNSSNDVAITGCVVKGLSTSYNSASGISITDSGVDPSRITIVGNTLYTTKKGVVLSNDSTNVLIANNLIVGNTAHQTNRQGIEAIPNTGGSKRWVLQHNVFYDCDLLAVNIIGTGTMSDVWVRGNIFINCGATPVTTSGTFDSSCVIQTIDQNTAYAATNVTTDRTFDADTVAVAELADIVGTLIADLKSMGTLS